MKKWRCTVCGYVHEGETPPDICPICGVGPEMFELVEEEAEDSITAQKPGGSGNPIVTGRQEPKAMQFAAFKISYGLYIVSSIKGDKINGQCANTVFQITSEPLRIVLGINKGNLTHEFIQESGVVGVTVLGENGHDLVRRFGYSSGRDKDKFAGLDYVKGLSGVPILKGGIAFLEGKILRDKSVDVGTHTLFTADVTDGAVIEDMDPMTYAYFRKTK